MTIHHSAHLSEEELNDALIGPASPEAQAHLAACSACRSQLEPFQADMQLFNRTTMAWSEARSATMLRPETASAIHRTALFIRWSWTLATAVLIGIGLSVAGHHHRTFDSYAVNHGVVTAPAPEDSEAQIAQDNELMQSVDVALSSNEESPIDEFQMTDQPHPRRQVQPESRNQ